MMTFTGMNSGSPPLQENQGALTHRSHHKITNWKSLLQLHCKGIGLDLPNSPCDPSMAICQRARGREGHLPYRQHRRCPASSLNENAAESSGRSHFQWWSGFEKSSCNARVLGTLPLLTEQSFFHGQVVLEASCAAWSYFFTICSCIFLRWYQSAAGFAFAI